MGLMNMTVRRVRKIVAWLLAIGILALLALGTITIFQLL